MTVEEISCKKLIQDARHKGKQRVKQSGTKIMNEQHRRCLQYLERHGKADHFSKWHEKQMSFGPETQYFFSFFLFP